MTKTKKCTKCEEHKELAEFHKDTKSNDGLAYNCKSCVRKRKKEWYKANAAHARSTTKEWVKNNYERAQASKKRWEEVNIERVKANEKRWRNDNSERVKANKDKWKKENHDACKKKSRRYMRKRNAIDPHFRLKGNLRSRLYSALKGNSKAASTMELVGCNIDYLWNHLIAQFTEGMKVENYGEWHVDHVRPCASFDLEDEEQQRECFHYSNLQPLWAEDNLSKGDRYDG
jgi:hypothetical protein